jgi:hypothetical protein
LIGMVHLLLVSRCMGGLRWVTGWRSATEDIHRGVIVVARKYSHWWLSMLLRLLSVLHEIH